MCIFHKWSPWREIEKGELFVRKWEGAQVVRYRVGFRLVQQRICEKCGKSNISSKDVY
jgi:hypothetical protein